jgi:hypothetical protein
MAPPDSVRGCSTGYNLHAMQENESREGGGQPEDRPVVYCYRCASPLDRSLDWCGTCGAGQTTTCHKCGTLYRKAEGRCPVCRTQRVRRRRRRRTFKVFFKETIVTWVVRHKRKLVFISLGFLAGIAVGAILKALADASMPEGMVHPTDSAEFWTEPFTAAWRTIVRIVSTGFRSVAGWIVNAVLMHLKTTILGVLGAVAGLLLALRADKRRRRSPHRRY